MAEKDKKNTGYREGFRDTVTGLSEASDWQDARMEWEITDINLDVSGKTACICGNEHIRYCFELSDKKTGHRIYPVSRSCIKLFGRPELDQAAKDEQLFCSFAEKCENGDFIELQRDLSRKLIDILYDRNMIDDWQHKFLTDMYNRRNMPTLRQKRMITSSIMDIKTAISEMYERKRRKFGVEEDSPAV